MWIQWEYDTEYNENTIQWEYNTEYNINTMWLQYRMRIQWEWEVI